MNEYKNISCSNVLIYIHFVCVCIYIYIYRERERELDVWLLLHIPFSVYIIKLTYRAYTM